MQLLLFEQKLSNCQIVFSNQLAVLADTLCSALMKDPIPDPFVPEYILVQTEGLKRWLSLYIAQQTGISANIRFLSPSDILSGIIDPLLGEQNPTSVFERRHLVWGVFQWLKSDQIRHKEAAILSAYIANSDSKCYQLANQIADLFDQYLMYRPELILCWEQNRLYLKTNPDERWQKQIWQWITEQYGSLHWLSRRNKILSQLQALPMSKIHSKIQRLWALGLTTLAPVHIEQLMAISQKIEVSLLLLNPCSDYWFDMTPEKYQLKLEKQALKKGMPTSALHLESLNPLLSAMGRTGQMFLSTLLQGDEIQISEHYQPNSGSTLLHLIQADILSGTYQASSGSFSINESDHSIEVVNAHSPYREVEILWDHCLQFFKDHPSAAPSDIIVQCTDINRYAPFIDAVFGTQSQTTIPYTIADQAIQNKSSIISGFLQLLNLVPSRYEAQTVLDCLECAAIRNQFGFSDSDLSLVQAWITETKIRWGQDGQSKQDYHLPPISDNTWLSGLQQLILGYAMWSETHETLHHTLPFRPISTQQAEILGLFCQFFETLSSHINALKPKRTLSEWTEALLQLIQTLFKIDPYTETEIDYLLTMIQSLKESADLTASSASIDFSTIHLFIRDFLSFQNSQRGFLNGGITFCSLVPMRSIPFKMIAILGLNDTDFPRQSRAYSFDLMAKSPKPLDRNVRDSDRYLFLETLLSAQEKLLISYVGKNPIDHSEMLPSIVVLELLDYVQNAYNCKDHIQTDHPLHGSHPHYFDPSKPKWFSYHQSNWECCPTNPAPPQKPTPTPFIPTHSEDPDPISMPLLIAKLINPAQFYLTQQLQARFVKFESAIEPAEPFATETLDKYQFLLLLYELMDANASITLTDCYEKIRAKGILPHAKLGYQLFVSRFNQIKTVINRKKQLIGDGGHMAIKFRPVSQPTAKDFITLWVGHLFAQHDPSLFLCLDPKHDFRFQPLSQTHQLLTDLSSIALESDKSLVPFIPSLGYTFWHAVTQEKSESVALKAAQAEWESAYHFDNQDPYFQYSVKTLDFLNPDSPHCDLFKHYSTLIFKPILENKKAISHQNEPL